MKKSHIIAISVAIMLLFVGYVMAGDKPDVGIIENMPYQLNHYGSSLSCTMNGTVTYYDPSSTTGWVISYDLEGYCGWQGGPEIYYVHYTKDIQEKFEGDLSKRTKDVKESYEMLDGPGGSVIATYQSQSKWDLEPEAPGPHN
jgi:hypothetical protein